MGRSELKVAVQIWAGQNNWGGPDTRTTPGAPKLAAFANTHPQGLGL